MENKALMEPVVIVNPEYLLPGDEVAFTSQVYKRGKVGAVLFDSTNDDQQKRVVKYRISLGPLERTEIFFDKGNWWEWDYDILAHIRIDVRVLESPWRAGWIKSQFCDQDMCGKSKSECLGCWIHRERFKTQCLPRLKTIIESIDSDKPEWMIVLGMFFVPLDNTSADILVKRYLEEDDTLYHVEPRRYQNVIGPSPAAGFGIKEILCPICKLKICTKCKI